MINHELIKFFGKDEEQINELNKTIEKLKR